MVNKRFRLGILVIVPVFVVMLSGCASQTSGGNFYFSAPFTFGVKHGEESNSIVFGLFGKGYPEVEKVARENDITKIATVEHYVQPGFLYLWIRYTTVVTGE